MSSLTLSDADYTRVVRAIETNHADIVESCVVRLGSACQVGGYLYRNDPNLYLKII
jgi:hypothetical protein